MHKTKTFVLAALVVATLTTGVGMALNQVEDFGPRHAAFNASATLELYRDNVRFVALQGADPDGETWRLMHLAVLGYRLGAYQGDGARMENGKLKLSFNEAVYTGLNNIKSRTGRGF